MFKGRATVLFYGTDGKVVPLRTPRRARDRVIVASVGDVDLRLVGEIHQPCRLLRGGREAGEPMTVFPWSRT